MLFEIFTLNKLNYNEWAIPELPFTSVSKRVPVHNLSCGNEFYLQDNERVSKTHFHNKGCAPGLVLKQRQTATREWPILSSLKKNEDKISIIFLYSSNFKYRRPNCSNRSDRIKKHITLICIYVASHAIAGLQPFPRDLSDKDPGGHVG